MSCALAQALAVTAKRRLEPDHDRTVKASATSARIVALACRNASTTATSRLSHTSTALVRAGEGWAGFPVDLRERDDSVIVWQAPLVHTRRARAERTDACRPRQQRPGAVPPPPWRARPGPAPAPPRSSRCHSCGSHAR